MALVGGFQPLVWDSPSSYDMKSKYMPMCFFKTILWLGSYRIFYSFFFSLFSTHLLDLGMLKCPYLSVYIWIIWLRLHIELCCTLPYVSLWIEQWYQYEMPADRCPCSNFCPVIIGDCVYLSCQMGRLHWFMAIWSRCHILRWGVMIT